LGKGTTTKDESLTRSGVSVSNDADQILEKQFVYLKNRRNDEDGDDDEADHKILNINSSPKQSRAGVGVTQPTPNVGNVGPSIDLFKEIFENDSSDEERAEENEKEAEYDTVSKVQAGPEFQGAMVRSAVNPFLYYPAKKEPEKGTIALGDLTPIERREVDHQMQKDDLNTEKRREKRKKTSTDHTHHHQRHSSGRHSNYDRKRSRHH